MKIFLRKKFKAAVCFFAFNAIKSNLIHSLRIRQRLIILNLHRISDQINPYYSSLTPKLFEDLLKFISQHFNVVTFEELSYSGPSDKPYLILSFDDGFYDFFEVVLPLLERYRFKANLNVIPACLDSGLPVWDVALTDILNAAPISLVTRLKLPGFSYAVSESNKAYFALALTKYLKNKNKVERQVCWEEILSLFSHVDVYPTRMLTKSDLLSFAGEHEIGVHSYSHETMGVESDDFFIKDFFNCKDYFYNQLKLPLFIYSFPSGSYRVEQIDFLLSQGIKNVLIVGEDYSKHNFRVHPRFTFYADTPSEVKLRACGFNFRSFG